MAIFAPQETFKTGTKSNPTVYIGTSVGATDTTLTFSSGLLDKDGVAPSGKICIVAKILSGTNAGYEEMILIPAGGLNAAGTIATGCIRGIVVSGRTETGTSSNTAALLGSSSTIIDVVLSPQHMQGILDVIDGDIGTGGASFRIGTETDVDITLYFQNADANKPYIQYDKTLNGFEMSIDGSTVETLLTASAFSPGVSDGTALGTTALMWSDLFLASGGVINFNNGDVTITHSANTLTFAGASTGYSFDDDLLLASGSVLNFDSGDVLITHAANSLAITGGALGVGLTPTANMLGVSIEDGLLTLKETTTPTADANYGKIYTKSDNALYFQDGAGSEHELAINDSLFAGMYFYESAGTEVISYTETYYAIQGQFSGDELNGWTFVAGSSGSGNITTAAAGAAININDVAHGLVSGDYVNVQSTNHKGTSVVTYVDPDNFTLAIAFVGNEACTWQEGDYLLAGASSAGHYSLTYSVTGNAGAATKLFKFEPVKNATHLDKAATAMTTSSTSNQSCSGTAIVLVSAGDRIWLQLKNRTDTQDWAYEHANLTLHRI